MDGDRSPGRAPEPASARCPPCGGPLYDSTDYRDDARRSRSCLMCGELTFAAPPPAREVPPAPPVRRGRPPKVRA